MFNFYSYNLAGAVFLIPLEPTDSSGKMVNMQQFKDVRDAIIYHEFVSFFSGLVEWASTRAHVKITSQEETQHAEVILQLLTHSTLRKMRDCSCNLPLHVYLSLRYKIFKIHSISEIITSKAFYFM